MKIPLVDLQAQLKPIHNEVLSGIDQVLKKCNFILGEEAQNFEKAFATFCGAKYAVGVASGLDALHLALRAAGVGPGHEVIVPTNTFIATALAVSMAGAKPVLVDHDPKTFLMDVEAVRKAITSKTKAILPVHLYGRAMDLDPILTLAKQNNLVVIEDTAQAHGAEIRGKKAGTIGLMGCFSFYPGKNLGGAGDGGMVVTDSLEMKEKIEALRNYGSPKKYHHPIVGFNSRLDTLQAVVLNAKLPHLDQYNRERLKIATRYNEALKNVGDLILPEIPDGRSHVFHLYVVRTKNRNALLEYLNSKNIGAALHYPVPVHLHGAYADLNYKKGSFPIAEQFAEEILSLPIYPGLTDEQLEYVITQVKTFFTL